MPHALRRMTIGEVSHVTRGANQHAKILFHKVDELEYWKRDFSADQRQAAASSGAALPDGSFPIESKQDLKNAIHALGRAKDKAKAKAHIISRARALGATDDLPDGWTKLWADYEKLTAGSAGTTEEAEMPETITKAEHDTAIAGLTTKVDTLTKGLSDAVALLKTSISLDHVNYALLLKDAPRAAFLAKTADERDAIIKAAPKPKKSDAAAASDNDADDDDAAMKKYLADMPEPLRKQLEAGQQAAREVAVLKERQETEAFNKMATDLAIPGIDGDMLRIFGKVDPKAVEKLCTAVTTLKKQVKEGGLMTEFGKGDKGEGAGSGTTAFDQLVAKQKELQKLDPKLTDGAAFNKACGDNPALYQEHQTQMRARH